MNSVNFLGLWKSAPTSAEITVGDVMVRIANPYDDAHLDGIWRGGERLRQSEAAKEIAEAWRLLDEAVAARDG